MAGLLPAIEGALREPGLVVRSRSDPRVELCYRLAPATLVGDKWLCVVIKCSSDDAFVLTAYLTDQPKTGEVLWPKP